MSLEPELPDLPDLPTPSVTEAVLAGAVAAHAAEKSAHHGPIHTHCENCGTKLEGPFCHKCGQHDFEFHRSFGHVFLDALENFFHFDSKLFHNIVTLLFSPGRLTADFNAGRRAAQMPPFRLYLFVSVLFFFISFLGSRPFAPGELNGNASPQQRAAVRSALDQALQNVEKGADDPRTKAKTERVIRRLQAETNDPTAKPPDLLKLGQTIADEIKKDEAATPAQGAPAAKPDGLNFSVDERNDTALARFMTEKGKYAYEHQPEMVEAFIHALPRMLLVCLPFFALYTRVLFRKSKQVYLQHLVLALHFHTFIFLWVLCRNGWVFLAGFASLGLKGWLTLGCNLWLTFYPLLMLRRLFANSWPWTIFKTGLLAFAYICTLGLGFLATAIILFLLL